MKYLNNRIKVNIRSVDAHDININHGNLDHIFQILENELFNHLGHVRLMHLQTMYSQDFNISKRRLIGMDSFNDNDYNVNEGESKGHKMLAIMLIALMTLFSTVIIAPFFREHIVYAFQWVKTAILLFIGWVVGIF